MKIRFFNTYEPVTSLYRDLVPHLASKGVQVEIVISKGEYRANRYLDKALAGLPGVNVVRVAHLGSHAHKGTLQKAVVTVLYAIHGAVYAFFGPRVDQNVFLSQPPLFSVIGGLLRLCRRQAFFCIVMDIQPELLIASETIRESFATRLLSWISKLTLRKADGVIVIGRCMALVVEDFGVNPSRIHYIPNWADERVVRPVSADLNSLRRDQGWSDRFVVLYAGSIGLPQDFDTILQAAEQVPAEKGILFVFIGGGHRRSFLRSEIKKRRLKNVVLLPFLHEEYPLAEILSAGDLHMVTLKEECTGYAVPSKTYGILAAGRPLVYLGSSGAEIARLIAEEGIGVTVGCGDAVSLAGTILEYAASPEKLRAQGIRARRLAEAQYSRRAAVQRYSSVLGGLYRSEECGEIASKGHYRRPQSMGGAVETDQR